ncbi:hypothetical protein [Chitinimonas koreensis]|uniref:hypothetical protein n=1 Tax=Chitinimonas koreensis TaxID=356302 RepID=UPI0003F6ABAA|nr:hypothetical protein [Chitinimonas koreensis]QNM96329.1 hypothetical protein H9L41_21450 [Chitinimonas koreensis]
MRSTRRPALLFGFCLCGAIAAETIDAPARLGRLFFSPEERAALDRLRTQPGPLGPSRALRFDGLIQQSGRPAVYWINGAIAADQARPGLRLEPDGRQRLRIATANAQRQAIHLKVGQTLEPGQDRPRERYEATAAGLDDLLRQLLRRTADTAPERAPVDRRSRPAANP